MQKYLLKLSFFIIFGLLILFCLEYIITSSLQKSKAHDYQEWNAIFSGNINADLVVSGSSKALRQLSPSILDSVLGCKSYNLGIMGHNYLLQNTKNTIYLLYNIHPKFLIQVVSTGTFEKREDLFNYQQFLPYIKDTIIQSSVKKYQGLNYWDINLPFIRYTKDLSLVTMGLGEMLGFANKNRGELRYKGYYAQPNNWDKSFDKYKMSHPNGVKINFHETSFELFKMNIKDYQNQGITVIMVFPPLYKEAQFYFTNLDSIHSLYKTLSNKYNIPYFDYSEDSICYNTCYFYNSQHLNKTGAEFFSQKFAEDLKKYLKNE